MGTPKKTSVNFIELKCDPDLFQMSLEGRKNFELRSTKDRAFNEGDILLLREFDRETKLYSGRELARRVNGVMYGPFMDGLNEDHAIISLMSCLIPSTMGNDVIKT